MAQSIRPHSNAPGSRRVSPISTPDAAPEWRSRSQPAKEPTRQALMRPTICSRLRAPGFPKPTSGKGIWKNSLLPNQSFDVVTGFNSFQYAGNPAVALAEARRVLRPEGTIVIATWGDPKEMEAAGVVAALKSLLPPPPPGAPGPFALSDEAALKKFAADAGLIPIEIFGRRLSLCLRGQADRLAGTRLVGRCGSSGRKLKSRGRRRGPRASHRTLQADQWTLSDRRIIPVSDCAVFDDDTLVGRSLF